MYGKASFGPCSDCIVGLLLLVLLLVVDVDDDIIREKDLLIVWDEENANDDVGLLILINKRSGYWKHLIYYYNESMIQPLLY